MFTKEQLDRLKEALVTQPVIVAYLFGSQTTGLAHAESDVDVAILLRPGTEVQFLEVQAAITATLPDTRLDVRPLSLTHSSPLFLRQVLSQGKAIYCADELARIQFEVRVLQIVDDTARLRQIGAEYIDQAIAKGTYGR